jgi:hypothetical protein
VQGVGVTGSVMMGMLGGGVGAFGGFSYHNHANKRQKLDKP